MKQLLRLLLLSLSLLAAACAPFQRATVVDQPPAALPPPASAEAATPPPPAEEAPAEPEIDLDAEIPIDPLVRTGTLENGLSYYVRVNGKPENRAELRLFLDAGSLQEDDDQQGLAHFVEHMAFNGTRNFEKQEIVDYLESIGMRFGADLNAYTSFDETGYQLTVPTDDPAILEKGFRILADWASGIAFEEEEVDKERGVIVEEWRLGRGAGARIRDQQLPVMLRGSRYAERLPIGQLEIIDNAPRDVLVRFYRDWYRPGLMAVAAVGDFDADRVEALIRESFADVEEAEEPRPRETSTVPPHEETLFSLATDPELSRTTVSVLYKHPAQDEGTYGAFRRSLVQLLYHGMLNARLEELTQEADPPYLYGFSGMGSYVRSATIFQQGAGVRDGEVLEGLEALLTEVERVDRHGFTATELERAKVNVLRGYEQAFRERDKLDSAGFADEYGRNFLEGESVPGIALEAELAQRFVPAITVEEVNRLASEWITDDNRVILVSAPDKQETPLPAEDAVLAVFGEVEASDVEPYVDEVRDEPLVAEPPAPGRVVERREIEELGVTEWRLSNGVLVVLKPTDFKNDQVVLTSSSPGGTSLVSDEDHASAAFATTILGESGLGEFSSIELGKALAGKVASSSPYISELDEGVSGYASPEDLETMFQLVYLQFTAPRLDLEVWQSLLSRLEIVVKNRLSRPQTVFQDKLEEVLSQGHPRRRPISEELLAEVDPEKALEIYRDRFADAGDFTFVLVGNFEPAEIEPLVVTYLGGLPAAGREETWRDVGVEPPDEVVELEVDKGLEPQSRVSLIFTGEAEWTREEAHRIRSLGQALGIRLREVLREDLGATYGVGVGGSLSRRPRGRYNFSIGFGCAPEEVESLIRAVFDEIAKVKEEGPDEDTVAKVREAQRRRHEVDLKENGYWLQSLQAIYDRDDDPLSLLEFDALVDALTVERLRDAARRYLDRERYVLGVLNPEGAGGEADPEGAGEAEP
jgi:zinc protease